MKKVFVLTVIAILALGVMTWAASGGALPSSASWGPTCNSTTLTVYSTITIEQGYVATATSYNASFCGVKSDVLMSSSASITENGYAYALLADLEVKSNGQNIKVTVTESGTLNGKLTFIYGASSGSSYDEANGKFTLDGSSTPYSGTLYVYGRTEFDGSNPNNWIEAGDYSEEISFDITPNNAW